LRVLLEQREVVIGAEGDLDALRVLLRLDRRVGPVLAVLVEGAAVDDLYLLGVILGGAVAVVAGLGCGGHTQRGVGGIGYAPSGDGVAASAGAGCLGQRRLGGSLRLLLIGALLQAAQRIGVGHRLLTRAASHIDRFILGRVVERLRPQRHIAVL